MATTLRPPSGARPDPLGERGDFSLTDKYDREGGLIYLSGIQALTRLPLDQHRADRRRGLHTGTFISGYRGSPLGAMTPNSIASAPDWPRITSSTSRG